MGLEKDHQTNNVLLKEKLHDKLIGEFILQTKLQNEKTKKFYVSILIDFYLFHGKEYPDLTIRECQGYIDYIKRIYQYGKLSEQVYIKKVNFVLRYLTFLHHKGLGDFTPLIKHKKRSYSAKSPSKRKMVHKEIQKVKQQLPKVIEDFIRFLQNKQYRYIEEKKRILMFHRYLQSEGSDITNFNKEGQEKLLYKYIRGYENMLSERITNEEICTHTAKTYLRSVQLFVKFLNSQGLIHKLYKIPLHLRGRSRRANEYVPKECTIELINTIYDCSLHVERDLAVFLIIVDTGCRPIELTNTKLGDLNVTERTIYLECGKTDRRKVKLSAEVMDVIKDYLDVREEYEPKTEKLFCNCRGHAITPSYINVIFRNANIQAFGEAKYPAKAFRHTYLTNALQEYSFERVSKAIGHKDWKSTYYYYYRSNQRLLTNTMNRSPLKGKDEILHANTRSK